MKKTLLAITLTLLFSASAWADSFSHTVKGGENLGRIGYRYGVAPEAIAKASGIRITDIIFPGQKLTIPRSYAGLVNGKVKVRSGDTWKHIALRFDVCPSELARKNGRTLSDTLYKGEWLRVSGTPKPRVSKPQSTAPAPAPVVKFPTPEIAPQKEVKAPGAHSYPESDPTFFQRILPPTTPKAAAKWAEFEARPGESIARIAAVLGCEVKDLVKWNPALEGLPFIKHKQTIRYRLDEVDQHQS